MEEKTISRDEAIQTLYEFIDNEVIDEDLSDRLLEIANNIDNEKYGIHTWGINNEDYVKIVTSYRDDLTDKIEEQKKLIEKYSFVLSEWEKENKEEIDE
jgi:hypothetical protein